jgi:predicted transcriptional regulator
VDPFESGEKSLREITMTFGECRSKNLADQMCLSAQCWWKHMRQIVLLV